MQHPLITAITEQVETGNFEAAVNLLREDYNTNGIQEEAVLKALLDKCTTWIKDNEVAELYCLRGLVYRLLNNYKEAIKNYNKAIELKSDYANAYYNRGNAYNDLKEYDKAIDNYNKALEINPDYVYAYYNRGLVYYNLKEYKKAIDDYDKAIEIKPNYADVYNNRGNAYYHLKEYEKAITDYTQCLAIDKQHIYANRGRGLAYQEINEHPKAITDFTRSIAINDEQDWVYHNRAESYEAIAKYEDAIADYKTFIVNSDDYYWIQQAKESIERLQQELKEKDLKLISKAIASIKNTLKYTGTDITHYTSLTNTKAMLLGETESPFRLSEAHYMNDTSEGEEFRKVILNKIKADETVDYKQKAELNDALESETIFIEKPFLGSFLGNAAADDLAMWRLYANTNGVDGCGCAITLDRATFLTEMNNFIPKSPSESSEKNTSNSEKESSNYNANTTDLMFYNVAYLDKEGKCINEEFEEINNALNNIATALIAMNKAKKTDDIKTALLWLAKIEYLFKSDVYQYEKEVRIILKSSRNPEHINVNDVDYQPIPRVYHNIGYIQGALKSITIGPKVNRPYEWGATFNYKFKQNKAISEDVEVHISKLPYK